MLQQDIETVELTIADAKKHVQLRDMSLKLASNREFKKVILENLFEKEAQRLVSLLADPAMAPYKESIQGEMEMISRFRLYLQNLVTMGNQAENAIRENEELLEELREQEAE